MATHLIGTFDDEEELVGSIQPDEGSSLPAIEGEIFMEADDFPREHEPKAPTRDGALESAANAARIYPVLDSIKTFLGQTPGFFGSLAGAVAGGAMEGIYQATGQKPLDYEPTGDIPVAMKHGFEATGKALGEVVPNVIDEPWTKAGGELFNDVGNGLEYFGRQGGLYAHDLVANHGKFKLALDNGDVVDVDISAAAPAIGAITQETIKMAGFMGIFKGLGVPKNIVSDHYALKARATELQAKGDFVNARKEIEQKIIWKTKADLISDFKKAVKDGDQERAQEIMFLKENFLIFNTAELPEGTAIRLAVNPSTPSGLTGDTLPSLVKDFNRITSQPATAPRTIEEMTRISKLRGLQEQLNATNQITGERQHKTGDVVFFNDNPVEVIGYKGSDTIIRRENGATIAVREGDLSPYPQSILEENRRMINDGNFKKIRDMVDEGRIEEVGIRELADFSRHPDFEGISPVTRNEVNSYLGKSKGKEKVGFNSEDIIQKILKGEDVSKAEHDWLSKYEDIVDKIDDGEIDTIPREDILWVVKQDDWQTVPKIAKDAVNSYFERAPTKGAQEPVSSSYVPGKVEEVTHDYTAKSLEAKKRQDYNDYIRGHGNQPEKVLFNELIQNSLDAINQRSRLGKDYDPKKHRKITVVFDRRKNQVIIEDTGIGMTPDIVKKDLSKLAEQGTKTGEDAGGYGFAKTVFFGMANKFKFETWTAHPQSKTGYTKTTLEGTNEGFFKNLPSKVWSEDSLRLDRGTRAILEMPGDFNWTRAQMALEEQMKSLKVPLELDFAQVGESGGVYKKDLSSHGWDTVPRKSKDLTIEKDGNTVKVYIEKVTPYGWGEGNHTVTHKIYNKGLPLNIDTYYLEQNFGKFKEQPDFKIHIDFEKTVDVQDRDNYPFTWNRQNLKENYKTLIQEKLKDFKLQMLSSERAKEVQNLQEVLASAPMVHGVRVVTGTKDGVINMRVASLLDKHPDLILKAQELFNLFSEKINFLEDEKLNLGITTRPDVHGFRPNPKVVGDVGNIFLINPFTVLEERNTVVYTKAREAGIPWDVIQANNFLSTIIHEYVHKYVSGHYDNYVNYLHQVENTLAAITDSIGVDAMAELRRKSHEFYKDNDARIQEIQNNLNTINEGWTRPSALLQEQNFTVGPKLAGTDVNVGDLSRASKRGEGTGDAGRPSGEQPVKRGLTPEQEAMKKKLQAMSKKKTPEPPDTTEFIATDEIKQRQNDASVTKTSVEIKKEFVKKKKTSQVKKANQESQIAKEEGSNELYQEVPLEQEFGDHDVGKMMKEFQEAQLFKEGESPSAVVSLKDVTEFGKSRGFDVMSRIGSDSKIEISVSNGFGDEFIFNTLPGAKEFMSNTRMSRKPSSALAAERNALLAEKKYYDVIRKEISRSEEFVKVEIPRDKPRLTEAEIPNSEIDFIVSSRIDSVPNPRPELWITKEGSNYVISKHFGKGGWYDVKPTGDLGMGISAFIKPMKPLMERMEARTKLPFSQMFGKIQDGIRSEHTISVPYLKRIKESFDGINKKGRVRMYRLLELKGFDEEVTTYADFLTRLQGEKGWHKRVGSITEKEYNAAVEVRKILRDAGTEFGIPLEKMIADYAPRIRDAGLSVDQAIKEWKLPEEYKWWAEEERTGYLMPHEEDLFKVVHTYVSRGARKKAIGPMVEEFSDVFNKAMKDRKLTYAESVVAQSFIGEVRGLPWGADRFVDATIKNFTIGINKALDKVSLGKIPHRYKNVMWERRPTDTAGETAWKNVGQKPGYFEVQSAVGDLVNLHLNLTYSGALGLRPMAVLRNFSQPFITTLPIVGPKHFVKGLTKAMTRDGMNEARAAGVLLDEYLPIPGDIDSFAMSRIESISQKTLWAYSKTDNLNRAISYHAMKDKILEAGESYVNKTKDMYDPVKAKKHMEDFIKETDLEFFHPVLIKNEVLPLLGAMDIQGLAQRMGKHLSDNTQWVYRRSNSPMFTRGRVGKVLGQFGTWPAWYIDYMHTLLTRGSKSNRAKRLALWVGTNAAIAAIGTEVFGVDMKTWVWGGPAKWQGGPMVNAMGNVQTMIASDDPYERAKAKSELARYGALYVPAFLALNGFVKAADEIRDEDKVKRMLGFTPDKKK